MIIAGLIESINKSESRGYMDSIITLVPDHRQKVFIQVFEKDKSILNGVNENDVVNIEMLCNGKIAKNSGVMYNNLIAVSITKI